MIEWNSMHNFEQNFQEIGPENFLSLKIHHGQKVCRLFKISPKVLRKVFLTLGKFPNEPQVVIRRQTPMRVAAVLVALVLEVFGLPR